MRFREQQPRPGGRRSFRCPGYDYTSAGYYFVTACTLDRRKRFGRLTRSGLRLTLEGELVAECWRALPNHFPGIVLDTFVVMPDHIHGIVVIPTSIGRCEPGSPIVRAGSLSAVVRSFKSASTRTIRRALRDHAPVWQRNYWECILRNPDAVRRVRRYIRNNPAKLMDHVARRAGWL